MDNDVHAYQNIFIITFYVKIKYLSKVKLTIVF